MNTNKIKDCLTRALHWHDNLVHDYEETERKANKSRKGRKQVYIDISKDHMASIRQALKDLDAIDLNIHYAPLDEDNKFIVSFIRQGRGFIYLCQDEKGNWHRDEDRAAAKRFDNPFEAADAARKLLPQKQDFLRPTVEETDD